MSRVALLRSQMDEVDDRLRRRLEVPDEVTVGGP
jgi:hypothetical protein